MSQNPISILVNNKRLSMMGTIFLSTSPPPFVESKEQENYKLCKIDSHGICLPPSPSEKNRYEKWHDNNQDEDYFSFPANNLATPNKARPKLSTQAFARLDTAKENNHDRTFTKLPQKAIVDSPKTTDNLVLQLEDTTIPPPMSSSCSTSTSEESDVDDLNQESSTVTSNPPVLQKHPTKDFDSYVSEFIRHSGFTMKAPKKRETPSVFRSFF